MVYHPFEAIEMLLWSIREDCGRKKKLKVVKKHIIAAMKELKKAQKP